MPSANGQAVAAYRARMMAAVCAVKKLAPRLQKADGLAREIKVGVNHHAIAQILLAGQCSLRQQAGPRQLQRWATTCDTSLCASAARRVVYGNVFFFALVA